jgi:hypothetical protein
VEDTVANVHNVTQLRAALDRGQARDKVNFPDPAAAPLGTDDEAAGAPPGPEEVRQAMQDEVNTTLPRQAPFAAQSAKPKTRSVRGVIAVAVVLTFVAAVIAVIVYG